ncbi:MAG: class I SAM-dependent methyltransferase [Betaproteobacteria bacterium]|nr:class I SAM-dependent methyltransferase [Betaproteobacteria bacterium]MDE2622472.1 class I SAM-dependent methyltransferase [Betaproteobacteria bacterium]
MDNKKHWEQVYATNASNAVSWFQEHAEQSMRLIQGTGVGKDAAIIDVGGGTSTLIDDLLFEGYTNITVLDLSAKALEVTRRRLGNRADSVTWLEGDVTQLTLSAQHYDLWHDRAVFHFLTDPIDRHAYVQQAMRSVRPGGHVIVATFAEDGPEKCSGLPTMRYCPESLHAEFGNAFQLLGHEKVGHHTPFGTEQKFTYCYCRME